MKCLFYCIGIWWLLISIGCKSVSKYPIDEKHLVKIDTNLLGIWKAVEDTDVKNYFLVQGNYDRDYNLGGNEHEKSINNYYISYFNHSGKNPRYQQWQAFLSIVGKKKFLNIGDLHTTLDGFFFVRIINLSADSLTTAIIADTTLKDKIGSTAIRRHILKNANNSFFYSDTFHFYKVSSYHLSISESIKMAN